MLCTASARPARIVIGLGLVLLMLVGMAGVTPTVGAEPEVIRTTPLDGEILQRTPTAVGVGFNEALDTDESTFSLLNTDGSEVEGVSISWGSDETSVTLNLPRDFPDGVYTITWNAVSASDGTSTQGWSSFSVGNPEDAAIITIPTSSSGHEGPPDWMQVGSRFVALLGIAASLAIWPIWRGIIRPALGKSRVAGVRTTMALQQWAWIALAMAIVGSFLELAFYSQALRDDGLVEAVMQVLGHEEWGFWWMVRMAFLVLLGIALSISPWWYANRARFNNVVIWTLSLMLPVPLVLSGHAMTDEVGRITTITSMWLYYVSLDLLVGGTAYLVVALRQMRGLANDNALSTLRARYTWLFLTAFGVALLTGFYLGTLFAGNLDAMLETAFGQALTAQIVAAAIALIIGIVLLVRSFSLLSVQKIGSALAVVLALSLISTAAMDIQTSGREELTQRSVQTREDLEFDGRPGIFLVAPGEVGVNHWRLEMPGTYLQTETEVYVELSNLDFPEIGSKEELMFRVQGSAFEHHGTELSLMGDWQITIRIEEPGFEPSSATYTQHIGEQNTDVNLPDAPWKFGWIAGLSGLSLALIGIVGFSTALVAGKGPLRKEAGGLAGVAVALAVVVVLQGRIDPLLVVETGDGGINPNDTLMVSRGEEIYLTQCASCHGVGLRGDGPLADSLDPPPVDFSQPHTKVHSDEDFIYWIQNGIQGTAMPGFSSQLDDQQIRDVIAFIYWWQQDDGASYEPQDGGAATPEPALDACEINPAEYSELQAFFQHGLHPETTRGTPLVRAADAEVSGEDTNDVMWTIEQLVNCANHDQFMSQIQIFTQPMMQEIFPQGANYEVTNLSVSPPEPVDPANAIAIQDVQSVTKLADGRVAVTVIFDDPNAMGVIPGANPIYQTTLVLIEVDGVWLIDEIR